MYYIVLYYIILHYIILYCIILYYMHRQFHGIAMVITLVITLGPWMVYDVIWCNIIFCFLLTAIFFGQTLDPSRYTPAKYDTASPLAKMMPWKIVVLCWKWQWFGIYGQIMSNFRDSMCLNSLNYITWLNHDFLEIFPSLHPIHRNMCSFPPRASRDVPKVLPSWWTPTSWCWMSPRVTWTWTTSSGWSIGWNPSLDPSFAPVTSAPSWTRCALTSLTSRREGRHGNTEAMGTGFSELRSSFLLRYHHIPSGFICGWRIHHW